MKPTVSRVRSIIYSCPIHDDCAVELVFGEDEEDRIPFPDPALKPVAMREFPDLVPIEAKHLKRRAPA